MGDTVKLLNKGTRERRFARTRLAILDAALNIIGSDGLAKLSMRRLAREIDYSPAALYEYFDGKEEIISALCERVDAHLADFLNQVAPNLSAEDTLVEIGMSYLEFARCNPSEYGMLFTGPFPDADAYGAAYIILLESAKAVVEKQLNDDHLSDSSAEELMHARTFAYSCWAMVHGMAVMSLRKKWDVGEMQTVHKAILQRFIYAH